MDVASAPYFVLTVEDLDEWILVHRRNYPQERVNHTAWVEPKLHLTANISKLMQYTFMSR